MSRIGLQLSKLRNEKGITQKQLGKLIGVTESFINDVEAGRKVLKDELLMRAYRALGKEADKEDIYDSNRDQEEKGVLQKTVKIEAKEVQQVWSDALAGILKTVPVYDYKMDKATEIKQLPIVSNKVEGLPKERVFILRVQDEDMTGFRIVKGDLALSCSTAEIEKDGIYFIEYCGKRVVRYIKRLDGDKLLLLSSVGSMITETAEIKSVKVLAKLIKLEIMLN